MIVKIANCTYSYLGLVCRGSQAQLGGDPNFIFIFIKIKIKMNSFGRFTNKINIFSFGVNWRLEINGFGDIFGPETNDIWVENQWISLNFRFC